MIGTISDPQVAVAIGQACGEAARDARTRLNRSLEREEEGQSASREEGFTDELVDAIDELGEQLAGHLAATDERFHETRRNVRVEFTTEKAPRGEEADFGLDIGIRVTIKTPGYAIDKAILVQCKRMYGAGPAAHFPALRGDGERQAKDMLRVTPASFFFLFNAGRDDELLGQMSSPLGVEPIEDFLWRAAYRHDRYFDPGVAVLPATRVLAMSEAKGTGPLPTDATAILGGSTPLGHFIASLFAPCVVGDVRTPVLQLATAPKFRESVRGLDAEVPELGHIKAKRFYRLKVSKTTASGG